MGPKGDKGSTGFYGKKGSMDYKTKYLYGTLDVMKGENWFFSPSSLTIIAISFVHLSQEIHLE